MARVYNMPRRLTDQRRYSKDGKLALAAWLSIKFAFGNSTLYDMSVDNIVKFFHVRRDRAKHLLELMWNDSELFYMNEKKNCIFAKSCRDKSEKINKRGGRYTSDDVITINVPECYLRDKAKKEPMALEELVRLIERALVCKEYDDQTGYKYSTGDHEGCKDHCETEVRKTQIYVARRTGLSRTKVGRILRDYVRQGVMSKTERCIVRSRKGERYAFKAVNKKTKMTYWAKCVPPTFSWVKDMPFKFRNLIWDAKSRCRSKFAKAAETVKKQLAKTAGKILAPDGLEFRVMVARQMAMREMYD